MTAAEYALGVALIAFSLGVFAGHAAGYMRAEEVGRRRAARAVASGAKYQRVGTPE